MRQQGQAKYDFVISLQRGIDVFELRANYGSLSVIQVASMLGYNCSAAYRFLSILKELGYVQQTHGKAYELTFKIIEPIFDSLDYQRFAMSISRPALRMSEDRISRMCDDLLSVSHELSRRLKERE